MSDFSSVLFSYQHAVQAYEALARSAEDIAHGGQSGVFYDSVGSLGVPATLPEKDRAALIQFTASATKWLSDAMKEVFADRLSDNPQNIAEKFSDELATHFDTLSPQARGEFTQVVAAVSQAVPSIARSTLMMRSVLIGIIGEFEALLAAIFDELFRAHPRALASEVTLTSAQLVGFSTIDELWASLREKEVRGILREGLTNWRKVLQTRLKIDLRKLVLRWDVFSEYFQRRHLLVHRQGRISSEYLRRVSPELRSDLSVPNLPGMTIQLGSDYIHTALLDFEVAGCLLGFEAWRKIFPQEGDSWLPCFHETLERALWERRWEFALRVGMWGAQVEGLDSVYCLLSVSLASKNLGISLPEMSFPELAKAVESSSDMDYILRLCAILGDADRFFEQIEATGGNGLSEHDWTLDPFFREFWSDPRFQQRWTRLGSEQENSRSEAE